MPGLEGAARELRTLIGKGPFIRRDRLRRALFLSDYPRLSAGEAPAVTDRLRKAGWRLTLKEGLALLDWPLTRYAGFFACLDKASGAGEDEPGLCPILRLHEALMDEGMLDGALQALLMWAGDEKEALKRHAEEALGAALRQKEKVPAFYRTLLQANTGRDEELC